MPHPVPPCTPDKVTHSFANLNVSILLLLNHSLTMVIHAYMCFALEHKDQAIALYS